MSAIKSSNTKPEILVRKFLHKRGLRFSLHRKDLPGTPDIVLPRRKSVVFVHGCFWHAHQNCKDFRLPATRTEWWAEKLEKNKLRDQANLEKLQQLGWAVYVIWTCDLSDENLAQISDCLLAR